MALSGSPASGNRLIFTKEEKGFTLLEILIASAIISILILALYGTLFPVIGGQKRIENELEHLSELRQFLGTFSTELQSTFFKENNSFTMFAGERGDIHGRAVATITFTAFAYPVIRDGYPSGDLRAIRYYAAAGDGNITLYKQIWNPYTERDADSFRTEVITDVNGFEIRYFDGKNWAKAWDGRLEKKAPAIVKVVIAINNHGEIREFSTISRIMTR